MISALDPVSVELTEDLVTLFTADTVFILPADYDVYHLTREQLLECLPEFHDRHIRSISALDERKVLIFLEDIPRVKLA